MTTLFLTVLLSTTTADEAYKRGLDARADATEARSAFATAARAYDVLWEQGARTAANARNRAQAHFLAGDIARSVGAYRAGLALWPHDPDLQAGLEAVREQVAYPRTGDLREAARPRAPSTTVPVSWPVVIALGAFYLAGWWLLVRAWFAGGIGRWLIGGLLVGGTLALGIGLHFEERAARASWTTPTAVVSRDGADFRLGNSDEYPRRLEGRLPAGVELTIRAERGGWLQVALANGVVGWIPQASVVEFR